MDHIPYNGTHTIPIPMEHIPYQYQWNTYHANTNGTHTIPIAIYNIPYQYQWNTYDTNSNLPHTIPIPTDHILIPMEHIPYQ